MKTSIALLMLFIAGCGSAQQGPAAVVSNVPDNSVVAVQVSNEEPADDNLPYGARTYDLVLASGRTYHIEFTAVEIKTGDLIEERDEDPEFTDIYAHGEFADYRYHGTQW